MVSRWICQHWIRRVRLVRSGKRQTTSGNHLLTLYSLALSNWHENLPPSLVLNYASPKNALPHILMMHLSHAWLVILLHRPFYRPLNNLPGAHGEQSAAAGRAAWAVKVGVWCIAADRPADFCSNATEPLSMSSRCYRSGIVFTTFGTLRRRRFKYASSRVRLTSCHSRAPGPTARSILRRHRMSMNASDCYDTWQ
jgi:hypothetical protein